MKSISSRGITGPEAILVATVKFWASRQPIEKYISEHVKKVGSEKFKSKSPKKLGQSLEKTGFPIDKMQANFWSYCKNNIFLKFMVETATKSQKSDKVESTKLFVNNYILEFLGNTVIDL